MAPSTSGGTGRKSPPVAYSPDSRRSTQRTRIEAPSGSATTARARSVVVELFSAYLAAPREMPEDYAGAADLPRSVADYIAGMTDRYALREHHRLTGRRLFAE